jgi:putative ABC transport system permease protein
MAPTATPQDAIDAFKAGFPSSGFEFRTRDRASPGLDRFVSRMGQFLLLVALAALAIAGIGIGNGVTGFLDARRGTIATLKILGATSGDVTRVFALQIAAASLVAIAVGLTLGMLAMPLIGLALRGVLPVATGLVFDPAALAIAAAEGLLIALTFAAPPLLRARAFPAMALLRARVSPLTLPWRSALLPVGGGLIGIVALAVIPAPQPVLALGFLGGAAGLFALLGVLGWGLTRLAAQAPRPRGTIARMALANLHRPGAQTPALVVAHRPPRWSWRWVLPWPRSSCWPGSKPVLTAISPAACLHARPIMSCSMCRRRAKRSFAAWLPGLRRAQPCARCRRCAAQSWPMARRRT